MAAQMVEEITPRHRTLRKESNNSMSVQHTRQAIVAPALKDRLAKVDASAAQVANSDLT